MKFADFVRKNQNVITGTRSTKISESIPISEAREKFYTDELFAKYDVVESDGKKLRILEKCSNYYACVDESGNIVRKFANALTLTEDTGSMWTDWPNEFSFHGYTPTSAFQENKELRQEWYLKMTKLDENTDDIALLKELKEVDKKVPMETDYKLRDKLTIAKLIADAVGISHDPASTPENLVNAAIRKARKDPALMRNKAVLANMLEIAKSVGIRFSDATFEVKKEVVEAVSHKVAPKYEVGFTPSTKYFHIDHIETGKRVARNVALSREKAYEVLNKWNTEKVDEEVDEATQNSYFTDRKKKKMVEEVLNEDPLNAWKNRMKSAGAVHYISGKHASGTTASKLHAYKIVDGKKVKVGAFDQVGRRGIKEDVLDEGMTKEYHHRMYLKAIKLGNGALAKHHAQIRDSLKEEILDELNIDTVKSYSDKVKTAPAKSMDKAIKRFGGQERAQDRIHKDELKKMTDRLKESEELVEKFGVFRKGGSIGDNKKSEPVKVHDTAEDAKAHAKRLNKLLSPGEKNYYGMKYHTKPVSEEVEPLTLKSLRKKMEMDVPAPDENDYAAKNKEMMGGVPTEVTPEMPDDNTGMTPDAIIFRDIVKKLNATMVPKSEVSTPSDQLPHGNAMNPTSNTHRKQLIKKLQGN